MLKLSPEVADDLRPRRVIRSLPLPFLKWVGGKRQLIPSLERMLPRRMNRYFEPFVGGGALFFHLKPVKAALFDINRELIDTYRSVRDVVEGLIGELRSMPHSEEHFYALRNVRPDELSVVQRAARMIYLNRTGFNGLYRVNREGRFNVPFGRYANPTICDPENLRACSASLKGAEIVSRSFDEIEEIAAPGDFVYFDPPYVPASPTASFTSYAADGFRMADQERLANLFRRLAERGVNAMLSNSDTPITRELYEGCFGQRVMARRNVNCDPTRRGAVGELVVTNYMPPRADVERITLAPHQELPAVALAS